MSTHTTGRGTAREQWEEAVSGKQQRAAELGKPITRDEAVKAVARERPGLREAMVAEANAARRTM